MPESNVSTLAQKIAEELYQFSLLDDRGYAMKQRAVNDTAQIISKAIEPLERQLADCQKTLEIAKEWINSDPRKKSDEEGEQWFVMRGRIMLSLSALHALKEGGGE